MSSAARMARHVLIRGRVQGVGFRAFVERAALQHAIEGWVRNRSDGAVEGVFAGAAADVARLVALCRHGPRGAVVEGLEEREADARDLALRRRGERFSVLPTA